MTYPPSSSPALNSALSDALEHVAGTNATPKERKKHLDAYLSTKVLELFEGKLKEKFELGLEDASIIDDHIRNILKTFVMKMELKIEGKEVLMDMLDDRVRSIIATEDLTISAPSLVPVLNEWWTKKQAELEDFLLSDKVLKVQANNPTSSSTVTNPAETSLVAPGEITFSLYHRQLPDLIKRLAADVPVWLWGAPGSGKNHMAAQAAAGLQLPFYPIHLGPTTTEGKLMGYRNASNGDYVPGLLYEPYTKGGLVFMDEIDVADPSVLVATNALVANDEYRFPDGILAQRHPNLRFLAGANTLGKGAIEGFRRNVQDAAVRDRWVKVHAIYDENLEMKLAKLSNPEKGAAWCAYVQKSRLWIEKNTTSKIHLTPRATINGATLLQAGFPKDQVIEEVITAEMPDDVAANFHKANPCRL